MESAPNRVVLTYRDYEALPADGRHYELHDGELVVTAAPGTPHQRLVGRLFRLLQQHVVEHQLGEVFVSPVDCILSDTTVVSRSTMQIDRGAKLQLYARHAIPRYWIVDPDERCIEAYALTEGVFHVVARLAGADRGCLPPFSQLVIAADTLWP